jgi:hypothetical protein
VWDAEVSRLTCDLPNPNCFRPGHSDDQSRHDMLSEMRSATEAAMTSLETMQRSSGNLKQLPNRALMAHTIASISTLKHGGAF